jgi:hypothetical protein
VTWVLDGIRSQVHPLRNLISVASTGVCGPFAIATDRPFGAWFEVIELRGATSVSLTTEISDSGEVWSVANVKPALVTHERYQVYVRDPGRYARLVVAVTAPGGWLGSVVCNYSASEAAADEGIAATLAQREAARIADTMAQIRVRLGISDAIPARTDPLAWPARPGF